MSENFFGLAVLDAGCILVSCGGHFTLPADHCSTNALIGGNLTAVLWWLLNVPGRDFPLKPPVGSHGADHPERAQR